MADCEHGQRDAHGEPGKDWCPGWIGPIAEPWREQLKFQMNSTPIYDDRDALTSQTDWRLTKERERR